MNRPLTAAEIARYESWLVDSDKAREELCYHMDQSELDTLLSAYHWATGHRTMEPHATLIHRLMIGSANLRDRGDVQAYRSVSVQEMREAATAVADLCRPVRTYRQVAEALRRIANSLRDIGAEACLYDAAAALERLSLPEGSDGAETLVAEYERRQ